MGAPREWILEVEAVGALDGCLGRRQVLPDRLLSIFGTGVQATSVQRSVLARLELAAITGWQMRFEAVVQTGFARQVASAPDLTAGRIAFLLHEIGEEAGHQQLFQRLLEPTAITRTFAPEAQQRRVIVRVSRLAVRFPAVLYAVVLAGEEIIDRFQQEAADDPATDPFVRKVYAFHRAEEANHVAFVQAVYAEAWVQASAFERALVRHTVPWIIRQLYDATVRPADYEEAGLPPDTWERVRRSATWTSTRAAAAQAVLNALVEAGALRTEAIPQQWRQLCRLNDTAKAGPGVVEQGAGSTESGGMR